MASRLWSPTPLHISKFPSPGSNPDILLAIFKSKYAKDDDNRLDFSGGRQLHQRICLCNSRGALGPSREENAQALELHRVSTNGSVESTARDSSTLPRPLSITDLSVQTSHGSQLRVAYQGVAGAYSEAAAAKAYPNCEAVPCEQFETAFEASFLCSLNVKHCKLSSTGDCIPECGLYTSVLYSVETHGMDCVEGMWPSDLN